MLDFGELEAGYRQSGWCRVELPDQTIVGEVRDELESRLRTITGVPDATLAQYHEAVPDERHQEIQWQLVNAFWDDDCCIRIARANLAFFRGFIGPDLHIQAKPYLRIARPGRREDNIGFHRDTFYGQSPYEVTVHLPLTDLDEAGALQFAAGSQDKSEAHYQVTAEGDAPWAKGSRKHLMGFPYAPKKIEADFRPDLRAIPVSPGQVIAFSPSLIHGQEVNGMATTRFSVDFRVVSTFAPIAIRKELGPRGYVPLHHSAVSGIAERYYAANKPD